MWAYTVHIFSLIVILYLHTCKNVSELSPSAKEWVVLSDRISGGRLAGAQVFTASKEKPQSWSYLSDVGSASDEFGNAVPVFGSRYGWGDSDRGYDFDTKGIWKLRYANSYWVFVSVAGLVYVANDEPHNPRRVVYPYKYARGLMAISYGNGYWVGANYFRPLVSDNPTNPLVEWRRVAIFNVPKVFYAIEYGDGDWVAAGGDGSIATTQDVFTSRWDAPSIVPLWPGSDDTPLIDLAYNAGTWVAICGENNEMGYTAEYAVKFTNLAKDVILTASDPKDTWSISHSSSKECNYFSIGYGNGHWVVVGRSGMILATKDPSNGWSMALDSGTTFDLFDVAYGNGHWVAVGNNIIVTTNDPQGFWQKAAVNERQSGTYMFSGLTYVEK